MEQYTPQMRGSAAEQVAQVLWRRLDLDDQAVFQRLETMRFAGRVAAGIAWSEDMRFASDRRLDATAHDVHHRFVIVHMRRRAAARCILDLEQRHRVARDQGLSYNFV